jgi:hypothetical protein
VRVHLRNRVVLLLPLQDHTSDSIAKAAVDSLMSHPDQ